MPFWSSKSSSRPQDPNPPRQELIFRANYPPSSAYTTGYATDARPDYPQDGQYSGQVSPARQVFGQEPTFHVVAPENSPIEQSAPHELPHQYYRSAPSSPGFPPEESSTKRNLKTKLGIHTGPPAKEEQPEPKRLQRRSSLREGRKEPQRLQFTTPQPTPVSQQPPLASNQWPLPGSQQYPLPVTSEEEEIRSEPVYSLQTDEASPQTSLPDSLQPPGSSSGVYPGSIQSSPQATPLPAHLQVYTNAQPNEAGVSPNSQAITSPGWPPRSPHPQDNPGSRPSSRQQIVHPSDNIQQYQSYNPEVASQVSIDSNSGDSKAPAPDPMAPPGASRQTRHHSSVDISKQQQPPLTREGSNLQYQRAEQDSNAQQLAPANSSRGTPVTSPAAVPRSQAAQIAAQGDLGREGTPPLRSAADMSEQETTQLLKEYKELREKYSKVKKYYFEKDAQVQQLQNVLAHQRLSQSRTSLDDSEYVARLNRLDGLIAQLAFGIRKDWKSIPQWLQAYVNKDAVTTGKQEMTAVGRAVMSRWLYDEVFEKYFHPSLDPLFSTELKTVQRNIRKFAPPFHSGEEEEALLAKTINWRLATVDGLHSKLNSPVASERRRVLIDELKENLVAELKESLNDPSPTGLEGGVHMIVEVAIGILTNLPLESRDVHIEYFMPGQLVAPELMKMESGIPALTNPIAPQETSETEDRSRQSSFSDPKDGRPDVSDEAMDTANHSEHGKKGFLGSMLGGGKKAAPRAAGMKQQEAAVSQMSLTQMTAKDEPTQNVRICAFMALEIRGKTVLAKAPVFST